MSYQVKLCPKCKESKPLTSFFTSVSTKDGYQSWCMNCNRENAKLYARTIDVDKRRLRSRRTMLKSKYGLSLEEYNSMYEEQGGVCAICGGTQKYKSNSRGPIDSLCVDHCHKTGRVRGLLCSECNFGISKFDDRLTYMLSAIQYLLKDKQIRKQKEKQNDKKEKN